VSNSILTAALLYVYIKLKKSYDKQVKIQEKQADISENQNKIMNSNFQPLLKINLYEIERIEDEEYFSMEISNIGNSKAIAVFLDMKIYTRNGKGGGEGEEYLHIKDSGVWDNFFATNQRISECENMTRVKEYRGRDILALEENDKISSIASTSKAIEYDGEYKELSFEGFTEFISNIEVNSNKLLYQFELVYISVSGVEEREYIESIVVPTEESISLADAVQKYDTEMLVANKNISKLPGENYDNK
jgi:hypothetical protein